MEQSEDARAVFHMSYEYRPEQLVFVDESSCDRQLSREYGRAARGRRITRKTIFMRGKRHPQHVKSS